MLFWVIFVLFVAVNPPSWVLLQKFGAPPFFGAFFSPSVFPSFLHRLGRKYSIVPTKLEDLLVSLALVPHLIPSQEISVAKIAFWDLEQPIIHIFALCGLPFSLQHDPRVFAPWGSHGYFYFTFFIPFVPLQHAIRGAIWLLSFFIFNFQSKPMAEAETSSKTRRGPKGKL